MGGLIRAVSSIFFSLLLGVLLFALAVIYQPDFVRPLQFYASDLKDFLINQLDSMGLDERVNILNRFVLQDEQFVLMFFVIVARVLVYGLLFTLSWIFKDAFRTENDYMESEALREERGRLEKAQATFRKEREEMDAARQKLEAAKAAMADKGAAAGGVEKLG